MDKRTLLIGFAALATSLASFADTPENMQVWLKNGEHSIFDISQVDSVTFGTSPQQEFTLLTENTMPPTFAQPIPLEVNDQELKYVKSTNEFGRKCFVELRKGDSDGVRFFSPISLNIALGLCANGATKEGAKEITDAMGFDSKNAIGDMNDFFNKIYLSLNSFVDSVIMSTSNAVWLDARSGAYPNFVKLAKETYYATIRNLDFYGDPSGSKDTIDHWAALATHDCIKNLSIQIKDDTKFVLNNACYFKGSWVTKFLPAGKAAFYPTPDVIEETDFMSIREEGMEYAETDEYQAVKLDYGLESQKLSYKPGSTTSDCAYSMIVVLPNTGHDLDEVWSTIRWDSIPFNYMMGTITMPKFKAAGGSPLKECVKNLGIKEIFQTCPYIVSGENYIDDIAQDFFINVDEEGTEAAAVTSIVGAGGAAMRFFRMTCDRPFAFAIRENKTGLILFMGEYNSVPKAEN